MASARAARTKLIAQRRSSSKKTNWVQFRNLTWFAMACSSEEIIDELDYLENLVQYVVGKSEYRQYAENIDNSADHSSSSMDLYEIFVDNSKLTSLFTNASKFSD